MHSCQIRTTCSNSIVRDLTTEAGTNGKGGIELGIEGGAITKLIVE